MRILLALVVMAGVAAANVKVTSKTIEADPIMFDAGKATIKDTSNATLDAIAHALTSDTKLALIEIQVHTDERGNDRWNLKLSQERAEAIAIALQARQVAATRLRAKGYGETQPLDKGHDEKAWARNRRTTFVILQRQT